MSVPVAYCTACGKEMFPEARYCTYCGAAQPEEETAHKVSAPLRVSEIRRVGIWSLVRFSFMVHAVIGLIFGILLAAVGTAGFPFPRESRFFPFGAIPWMSAVVVIPLVYGLIGAVLGFCAGSTYNLLAWGIGGIRVTLKES